MKYLLPILIFFFLAPTVALSQSLKSEIAKLDAYIEKARMQWEEPGLSIAIVKDGETLLQKGYGICESGNTKPVDKETIFAICSTTKAMTSAAMAMLVDEGKVNWDDKVQTHMPEFILYDPYVTRELKVRDLFSHNAGLGNADMLWYMWDHPTDDILNKMRMLKPSYSFRGGYSYQNIMYAAAGKLIEKVSGKTWSDFLQERIFDPLGMANTFPTKEASLSYQNRSVPHHFVNGAIVPIKDSNADRIGPAGSIWASIEDMTKWMHFVLDSAVVNGNRLISKKNFEELFKPHAIIPDGNFYPTYKLTNPHWKTYALGWFQHDYNGRAVNFHTGSLAGTTAIIGLIPDENLGVYVFGNLDHAEVRHALMYKVFDVFGPDDSNRDWSTELKDLYAGIKAKSDKDLANKKSKRVLNTKPFLEKKAIEGVYKNDYLGDLRISIKNENLMLHIEESNLVELEHFHFETYLVKWKSHPWRSDGFCSFEINSPDNIKLKAFGHSFKKVE